MPVRIQPANVRSFASIVRSSAQAVRVSANSFELGFFERFVSGRRAFLFNMLFLLRSDTEADYFD